jgi:DNA-binding transcriptional LysR family regulator
MELRQLRCFVAVAEELHFGRAARRLNISQPPLTRTILQLEKELEVALFERTKRRVELTPAGQVLLAKAGQILSLADRAAHEVRRAVQGHVGILSVSFVGSALFGILPGILREMRLRHPEVEVELHEMATDQQVAALLERRTHAAFIRPGIVHPELESRSLLEEELVVALPIAHPLARKARVSFGQLRNDPFVLFPRQTHGSLGNRILDLCLRAGFRPQVVQEALEMQTALGLVAGGLGIAVVPGGVRHLAWPGVVLKPLPDPAPTIELALAYRKDETSPILPHFAALVARMSSQPRLGKRGMGPGVARDTA